MFAVPAISLSRIFSPKRAAPVKNSVLHIHVRIQKEIQHFSVKRQKYSSIVKAFCNRGLPTYSKHVITPYESLPDE